MDRNASETLVPDKAQLFANAKCVILDFDGVVVDSEPFSLRSLRDTLTEFGVDISLDEVRTRFLGRSLKAVEAHVATHGPDGNAEGFAQAWQSTLFEMFHAKLCVMPGLLVLLGALDRIGLSYCVASSSSFERLGVALDAIHLNDKFAYVFSAEQVERGKPAPDLFLLAAAKMRTDPSDCLVIEDSPHGIQAASAAGMQSIGFLGGSHLRDIRAEHRVLLLEAGAAHVVTDYADLLSAIEAAPQALGQRGGGAE